jgi:hypothetical protein
VTRRPGAGGLAATVLLLLTGCASVPDSGPVRRVEGVTSSTVEDSVIEQPEVLLLPPEPVPGLSPEEVLRGFLAASAASDDDHALARQYLTPEASAAWDDDAEVVVHDPSKMRVECRAGGGTLAECSGAKRLLMTSRREAVIDSDGAWSVDQGSLSDVYGIERVDGEWRLSQVPPGVRLTPADVARTYRAVSVNFLDPPGDQLVADRVFLPVVSRTLPRLLVEALLRGPTSRLEGAVRTAVPPGTELRGLTLEGGVVQVDLTAPAAAADGDARQALSAQLVATLRQVPDVTGVRLLVDGEPLDVPGVESTQPIDGWPQFEPRATRARGPGLVLADDGVRPLTPGSDDGLGAPIGPPLTDAAVDLTRGRLAGLREAGEQTVLWSGRAPDVAPRFAADRLAPPSWGGGRYGVWTARPGGRAEVVLVPDTGEPVAVPVPQLARAGGIREVRVSRDDVRIALVVGEGEASRLYVGVLAPDESTAAGVAIRDLRQVAPSLTDVQDVSWADGQQLTVLARSEGAPAAWAVLNDGSVVAPLPVSGLSAAPTALASAPGSPLLLESGGQVWQVLSGVARSPVAGTDPLYPG